MTNPILAGLVAAIPLAIVLAGCVLVRRKALLAFFQGQDEHIAKLPAGALLWIILAGFVGAALLFGTLAGLVFGRLGTPRFQYLAAGTTVLLSVLAVASRQPLPGDKIAWNLAVGIVLGALVPLLAG